ncbi:MAG: hydantoinase B/oxoprolinase family protein, partial [Candidatus Hydrogenedentes bacterium]|nr:hydantoinase B/oxoprolinase family protein [Candidatus Hydrogenedentota bacterium]
TAHTIESVALGCIRVANEHMAEPIKKISVSRGYDVQEYALCSFGGAGAQHACAVAGMLGIRTIMLHPLAGVLSAYGLGLADTIHTEVEAVLRPFDSEILSRLAPRFEALEAEGRARLSEEGFDRDRIEHLRSLDMRYAGTDAFLNVPLDRNADAVKNFRSRHEGLYGFVRATDPIEVVNLRVESVGKTDKPSEPEQKSAPHPVSPEACIETVNIVFEDSGGGAQPTPIYRRADLEPGHTLAGPALIVEEVSTIVVDPGWTLEVNGFGHLILRHVETSTRDRGATDCDPIMLEVFNNVFMSIAEQMGETLERVSHSVNIKERLDFSCALFDEHGELVANAPHIPVHLGAMSESVRAIIAERGDAMRPGDVYLSNDPYHGGSHLPDITAVTPVEMDAPDGAGKPLRLFVANRGHHADIGGITPGSMPPFSKTIDEEGVVIHNFPLISEGEFQEEAIVDLLRSGPYPARNIPERLSDLRAQIAANAAGHRLLTELCAHYGTEMVRAYMGHVRENAATAMRDHIASIPDGVYTARDRLDEPDAEVVCTITIEGDRATVDFEGTSPQLPGNLNAPRAVVMAAVLYAFRCLIGKPVPLNSGCLEPITLRIPEGSLLSPAYPAAVVGGNVETSIRVVDVVFAALKAVAGSQGTMNNFTFGTKDWGYYETICGGAGAGPGFNGASAVHTHMTNTRITDPEVLERRYPVVLRAFSIRRGSGGRGDHSGGDGVVREIEFLEPVSVGILSERRTTAPYSIGGAEPGKPGRNRLHRGDTERELPGHVELDVEAGDVIIIETPGGGGYSGA